MSWGKEGKGNGEFNAPTDVDVDPNTGYVFAADVNNNRIQKFDNNGMFISKWFLSGIP
jgi:tripartite motif-containing protein 71